MEFPIVKRCMDNRPFIILPDNGLTLLSRGYTLNVAHQVLLAFDQPEKSKGQAYNAGDEQVLTLYQYVKTICDAMGKSDMEIISIPNELVPNPSRPLLRKPSTHHEVFSIGKLVYQLGYKDIVPAPEALALSVKYLAEHFNLSTNQASSFLHDPFDYETEDKIVHYWRNGDMKALKQLKYKNKEPGYTKAGYSPGINPYDGQDQIQRHSGTFNPATGKRE